MDKEIEEIWNSHVIDQINGIDVLYIDKLLLHDLTSLRALQNIVRQGKSVLKPKDVFVIPDHIPFDAKDTASSSLTMQVKHYSEVLGLNYINPFNPHFGITHLITEQLNVAAKGSIIAGGDSHITSAGAFGLLSFAVGTKDIERILLTHCLPVKRPDQFNIYLSGNKYVWTTGFDIMLFLLDKLSNMPVNGRVLRYVGNCINEACLEEKMILCNFSADLGVFSSIIFNDNHSIVSNSESDKNKHASDKIKALYKFDISSVLPRITFSTLPNLSITLSESIPYYKAEHPLLRLEYLKGLEYMGFKVDQKLEGIKIGSVFIGSCIGGKFGDILSAEAVIKGKKVASHVKAFLSVGTNAILNKVVELGIIDSFRNAGFEILSPGCSMCTSLSEVSLENNCYIVSTISRNCIGRQGQNVRTLLASPISAAHFAVEGFIYKYH